MEPLIDPTKDRVVKSVKPPPHRPLAKNLIWPDKNKSKKYLNNFNINQ